MQEGFKALNLNRDNILKIMGLILFTVLLYAGLQNTKLFADALRYLFGLMAPFVIGGCIAFVLNVPMRFLKPSCFPALNRRKGKGPARRSAFSA